ncbi:hypothetical protein GCM10018965_019500 [Nonomuraea roseola]
MTTRLVEAPARTPGQKKNGKVGGGLLDPKQMLRSLPDALRKLNPATLWRNPVMLIVEIGAAFTTVLAVLDPSFFAWAIVVWLWLTVVFANLAEAVAEGRGKAQAATLRKAKTDAMARKQSGELIPAPQLRQGDIVVVEAGEIIPGDGDVIEGIASVDESAITGESAPVIRESGGDRSAVTGGTKVLSDKITVRITQKPGESFIDRMIALVEGANRQKTPNEIALNILLAALTIIFLVATVTMQPLAIWAKGQNPGIPDSLALTGDGVTGIVLISLLVCLIPTTIGALLSAIGIAGMDRLVHARDADGRQQGADGRRDETDQQRDQHDAGDTVSGQGEGVGNAGVLALGPDGQRLHGHGGDQEDDRERGQQDVERDLVRRLLPVGALDEGDHPIDEALARLLGDPDGDLVGEHLGAAGHRGTVTAGLADHRSGLAGDGRLVHAGDALDHVAVTGDDLPGLDDDDVALPQLGRGDQLT